MHGRRFQPKISTPASEQHCACLSEDKVSNSHGSAAQGSAPLPRAPSSSHAIAASATIARRNRATQAQRQRVPVDTWYLSFLC